MRSRRCAASMPGCSAIRPSSRMSPTRMRGSSDANGSWNTIWMSRRTSRNASPCSVEQVAAVEQRLAAHLRLPAQQLHDGLSDGGLAAARLAHQRQRAPAVDAQAHVSHRIEAAEHALQHAAANRITNGQVLHVQQHGAAHRLSRVLSAARGHADRGRRQRPRSAAMTHRRTARSAPDGPWCSRNAGGGATRQASRTQRATVGESAAGERVASARARCRRSPPTRDSRRLASGNARSSACA